MEKYTAIGVMSGTSLDGLDIAYCTFEQKDMWTGKIEKAITLEYPEKWSAQLAGLMNADAQTLAETSVRLGHFIGKQVNKFIVRQNLSPQYICSHGHTVFHQPEKAFTLQIGDGNAIAAETGLPVIFDFRSLDVALGGQGAPLVPIGDKMLFGEYAFCLNLGGIANISFEDRGERVAFDISAANMLLNHLSAQMGHPFDKGGEIASLGSVDTNLYNALNALDYFQVRGVKTLGREWFEKEIMPLVDDAGIDIKDKLCTAVEHIAHQIYTAVSRKQQGNLLLTGGGALNHFLVSRIRELSGLHVVVPDENIVHFKEAYIFAFLGILRIRGEVNCLSSVTGARRDSSSGLIVQ